MCNVGHVGLQRRWATLVTLVCNVGGQHSETLVHNVGATLHVQLVGLGFDGLGYATVLLTVASNSQLKTVAAMVQTVALRNPTNNLYAYFSHCPGIGYATILLSNVGLYLSASHYVCLKNIPVYLQATDHYWGIRYN